MKLKNHQLPMMKEKNKKKINKNNFKKFQKKKNFWNF